MRKPRVNLDQLIKENIEELMSDSKALNEIESRLEEKNSMVPFKKASSE